MNAFLNFQFSILNFTSAAWQATFGASVLEEALSQRLPHLWERRRAYSSCVIAIGGIVTMRVPAVKPPEVRLALRPQAEAHLRP